MFPDKNPTQACFKPLDNRIPRMKIPRDFCPPEFFVRSDDFKDFLFVAEIDRWDIVGFALGEILLLVSTTIELLYEHHTSIIRQSEVESSKS